MFDRLIRYLPVLDYIRKYHPARILEVGSGPRGLGEFYDAEFTGCDLVLDGNPVHNMTFVQCSASDLPFSDCEFDLVVCMDVMEHISEKKRGKVLREIMRVTLHAIIIGYPCGDEAVGLSRKMLTWFKKRGSGTAKWMEEHVQFGLPSNVIAIPHQLVREKQSSFEAINKERIAASPTSPRNDNSIIKIKEINNENLFICEYLLKLEENGRFLKLEKFLFTHFRSLVEFLLRRLSFGKCYRKIWVVSS